MSVDRYVSFRGIDFEGNMRLVLGHLDRYVRPGGPAADNPFWKRFLERLAAARAGTGGIADELLLLHSHVYYLVDLFEDHDDEAALADLQRLERECF